MADNESQLADAMRDMAKQAHLRPLFDEAQTLFGERLTDSSFGGSDTVRLSVLDLDEADTAAILAAARQLGIAETAVQIEKSDPAALEAWERLRPELDELRLVQPPILQLSPSTNQRFCHPPFDIHLSADAEPTAEQLHRNYGKFVSLSVGALAYPPTTDDYEPHQNSEPATTADPHELRAELDGPLSIKRGQTAVHHLHVTNLSNQSIEVHTNGQITTTIIDPATGKTVGGYWGYQNLPLIIFTAAPAETVRIPLLVGTASFQPTLGYTVPPGTWGLLAPLHLGDRRHLVCGPMDVTITD